MAKRQIRSYAGLIMLLLLSLSMAAFLTGCGSSGGGSGSSSSSGGAFGSTGTASSSSVKAQGLVNTAGDMLITNAVGDQSEPDVAYDTANNRYLVVWTSTQNSEALGKDIYGAIYSPASGLVVAPFAIANTINDQLHPKVAFDTVNNVYLVAWANSISGGSEIDAQRITTGGAKNGSMIRVTNAPRITTLSLPGPQSHVAYNQQLVATGGTGPYSWSWTTDSGAGLPSGLDLNSSTGFITGTPTVTYYQEFVKFTVTDTYGASDAKVFRVAIGSINGYSIASGNGTKATNIDTSNFQLAAEANPNENFSYYMQATGGSGTYTWNIVSGALPDDLTLDADGLIHGTFINTPQSAAFVIRATDTASPGNRDQENFVFPVNAAGSGDYITVVNDHAQLAITTTTLPGATFGEGYIGTFAAIGGRGTYTWAVDSGTLPTGLSLDGATGVISGTTTAAGTFTFTMKATDTVGSYAKQTYIMRIYSAPTGILAAQDGRGVTDTSHTSPAIVFDSNSDNFIVTWVDQTSDEVYYDFSPATCGGDSTPFPAFLFEYGIVDDKMVRSRRVLANGTMTAIVDVSNVVRTAGPSLEYKCITDFGGNPTYSTSTETITYTSSYYAMIGESSPAVTFDPSNGTSVTAWSGKKSAFDLTYTWTRDSVYNSSGYAPGQPGWGWKEAYAGQTADTISKIIVRNDPGLGEVHDLYLGGTLESYNPSVTYDDINDKYLVAWEGDNSAGGEGKNIYGDILDRSSFSDYSGSLDISTTQYDQTKPKIAFDPSQQRYLVAWEDARNTATNVSNMDVYGQFIDPQGQLSGSNFIMTTNTSNQQQPAIAYGDTQAQYFMIAWKDGRNATNLSSNTGQSDIYANLWQYSTAPTLTLTDNTGAPIFTGSYDFGGLNVNDSASFTFRMYNEGNAPLTIDTMVGNSKVHIDSLTDNAYPFNITTPVPTTIQPGAYYPMTVLFKPIAGSSTYQGTVSITSNGGSPVLNLTGFKNANPALIINTSSLSDGMVGSPYSDQLTASGGSQSYTYSVSVGSLPDGLFLNASTGAITGTPTTVGSFNFTIKVTDSVSVSATQSFTVDIASQPLAIVTASLVNGSVGSAYSVAIEAIGGTEPYSFARSAGSLPTGLTLNASTGVLSGTPSVAGTYNFTVRVTDDLSLTASQGYSVVIAATLNITKTTLTAGTVGSAYIANITTAGGFAPYTYTLVSGALPAGLELDTAGGLNGTPSTSGSSTFSIQVTDSLGATDTQAYTLTINAASTGGTDTGTGTGTGTTDTGTSSGGGGGGKACFIATAAYGSYLDPHVMALRNFRDEYLLTNPAGRAFVKFYYKNSPPIADFIARHDTLRAATRLALTPLVYGVQYPLFGIGMILAGAGAAGSLIRRRRKAQ